ncbi:hypothetical protein DM02DRAFT_681103 [Periconia macrospinosa]|uniref:Uncharacterized protein n=1 Tax=Periconia macrospinosa TaxID=97972 RepID=A0A2V1DKR3_9PLEO|nr:hypothetical protein DM02DRAFT_681103 [Periconia macrospinosa]
MSYQTRISFRHIVQTCREFEGEAVYTCLASSMGEGGGESERTVKEVMIRSLGIHVISLAAYGHLTSLQGVVSARLSSWTGLVMIMAFFLVPEVTFAQLVWRVWRGSLSWFRRRRRPCSFWYCIATSLGVHIPAPSMGTDAVPLHMIDPASLHYKSLRYDALWVGRFMLLLLLMVQYMGSLGIRYRTYTVYADRWNSFGFVDGSNFHLALGGLTAVINSILLALTNLTWHFEPEEDFHLGSRRSTYQDMHTESPPPSGPLPTTESSNDTPCLSVSILQKLQKHNDIFTARLEHSFPATQQRLIEGAIILFTIADSTNWLARHSNPYFLDLSMLIKEKNPDAANIESLPVFEYSTPVSLGLNAGGPFLRLRGFLDIYFLPYISSILVILSFWSRLFAGNAWLGRYMPRQMRVLLIFCDKWITGGRSLVSFPCIFVFGVFLMGWYDFNGMWPNYLSVAHFAELANGTHWEQLHAKAYMFKDPC